MYLRKSYSSFEWRTKRNKKEPSDDGFIKYRETFEKSNVIVVRGIKKKKNHLGQAKTTVSVERRNKAFISTVSKVT